MSKPRLLTTKGAAQLLGITTRQIARRVERGKLHPAFKFPGATGGYLFDPEYIEELAAQKALEVLAGANNSSETSHGR